MILVNVVRRFCVRIAKSLREPRAVVRILNDTQQNHCGTDQDNLLKVTNYLTLREGERCGLLSQVIKGILLRKLGTAAYGLWDRRDLPSYTTWQKFCISAPIKSARPCYWYSAETKDALPYNSKVSIHTYKFTYCGNFRFKRTSLMLHVSKTEHSTNSSPQSMFLLPHENGSLAPVLIKVTQYFKKYFILL